MSDTGEAKTVKEPTPIVVGAIYCRPGDPEEERMLCIASIRGRKALFYSFGDGLLERRPEDMARLVIIDEAASDSELDVKYEAKVRTLRGLLTRLENKIATLETEVRQLRNSKKE